jgi:hypothetical protein
MKERKVKYYIEILNLVMFSSMSEIMSSWEILVFQESCHKNLSMHIQMLARHIICHQNKLMRLITTKKLIYGQLDVYFMKWLHWDLLSRLLTILLWLKRLFKDKSREYQRDIQKIYKKLYNGCFQLILKKGHLLEN